MSAMTPQIKLYRQPWDPAGSGDARSIQNAMGRTSLDLWNLLLRETLQNSWDAKKSPNGSIRFEVSEFELTHEQTHVLLDEIFQELPPEGRSKDLRLMTNGGRMRVIAISDYGTRGLGGPIRADVAPRPGTRSDFADFVRNFGRSQSKGLEGGTFGLGKGVLYSASRAGLCLVYSQPEVDGKIEPRLIGVSGGDSDYVDSSKKYTGRNWWGIIAEDNVVDPVINTPARDLAVRVGMPVPEPSETGTCIMILAPAPYVEEEGVIEAHGNVPRDARIKALRDACLTWAWPHALDLGSGPSVKFAFKHEGIQLPDIDPLAERDFRDFAQAYVDLISSDKGTHSLLTSIERFTSGKRRLGSLATRRSPEDGNGAPKYANHVALTRNPRIVVRYMPISNSSLDHYYHSIFVAHTEADKDFADSEPVAHDDWVIKPTQRFERSYVRIALNRIKKYFSDLTANTSGSVATSSAPGVSKLAAALGGLVGSFTGQGAGGKKSVPSGSQSNGGSTRKPTVRAVGQPSLINLADRPHVEFTYTVQGGRSGSQYELIPSAVVLADGAVADRENDPAFGEIPRFVHWRFGDGSMADSARVTLPYEGTLSAVFTQPSESAVRGDVELREVLQ